MVHYIKFGKTIIEIPEKLLYVTPTGRVKLTASLTPTGDMTSRSGKKSITFEPTKGSKIKVIEAPTGDYENSLEHETIKPKPKPKPKPEKDEKKPKPKTEVQRKKDKALKKKYEKLFDKMKIKFASMRGRLSKIDRDLPLAWRDKEETKELQKHKKQLEEELRELQKEMIETKKLFDEIDEEI